MNGYWCYMLGKILKPTPSKKLTPENKEAFVAKLMKLLIITDSI